MIYLLKSKAGEKDARGVYHDENGKFTDGPGGGNGKLEDKEAPKGWGSVGTETDEPKEYLERGNKNRNPSGELSELGNTAFDLLKCNNINYDDEMNARYQKHLKTALSSMPDAAIKRVLANVKNIRYFKNSGELTAEYLGLDRTREGRIAAGIYGFGSGEMGLDGGGAGNPYETYTHEMCHSMDGIKAESSRSKEWGVAYKEELADGQLNNYSSKLENRSELINRAEGFAEFGRLLYGTDKDLGEIEKKFPKASQFWKDKGYWPESKSEQTNENGLNEDEKAKLNAVWNHPDFKEDETKPQESKPPEAIPIESKLPEAKPVETKPVEEKPPEATPVEKPKETKKPEPKKDTPKIPKEARKGVSKAKKQINNLTKRIKKSAASLVKKLSKKSGRGGSGQRGFNRLSTKVRKQINDKALRAYSRLAKGKDRAKARGILQTISDLAKRSSNETISYMERIWNRELRGTPLGKSIVKINDRFWEIKSTEDVEGNIHSSENGQFVSKPDGEKGKGKLEKRNKESDYLSSASDLEDEYKDSKAKAKRAVSFGNKAVKKQTPEQQRSIREYGKERISDLQHEDQIVGTLKPIKNIPLGDVFTQDDIGPKQKLEDPKKANMMVFAGTDIAPGLGEIIGYYGIDKDGKIHRFEYYKEHDKVRLSRTKDESRRDKKFGGMKTEEYRSLMDRAAQQQNVKQPEYKFFVKIDNRFWEVKYSPDQPRGEKGTPEGGQFVESQTHGSGEGRLEEKDKNKEENDVDDVFDNTDAGGDLFFDDFGVYGSRKEMEYAEVGRKIGKSIFDWHEGDVILEKLDEIDDTEFESIKYRLDELQEDHDDLLYELVELRKKQTKAGNEEEKSRIEKEIRQKYRELSDHSTLLNNVKIDINYARRDIQHKVMDILGVSNSAPFDLYISEDIEKSSIASDARMAKNFVKSLVNGDKFKKVKVCSVVKIGGNAASHVLMGKRAHYDSNKKSINVNDDSKISTHVHEFGHHLEYNLPEVQKLCNGFAEHRKVGSSAVSMYLKFPGRGYRSDEIGDPDDFGKNFLDDAEAAYIGKRYADGGTEILSMGVEEIYNNPVGFAKNDPEYFKFVVGVLRGEFR